jgi:hypothetical protein
MDMDCFDVSTVCAGHAVCPLALRQTCTAIGIFWKQKQHEEPTNRSQSTAHGKRSEGKTWAEYTWQELQDRTTLEGREEEMQSIHDRKKIVCIEEARVKKGFWGSVKIGTWLSPVTVKANFA